jgi:hypothetical protein
MYSNTVSARKIDKLARKSQLEENPGEIVPQQLMTADTNCYRLESGVYSSAGPPKTTDKAEGRQRGKNISVVNGIALQI